MWFEEAAVWARKGFKIYHLDNPDKKISLKLEEVNKKDNDAMLWLWSGVDCGYDLNHIFWQSDEWHVEGLEE